MEETKEKSLRYNEGKEKWSLVHFKSLKPMVDVLEFGAKKYSPDNWKKGLDRNEILESMMRHLTALMDGEEIDKESGLSHIGHIQCNAMFYSFHYTIIKEENKLKHTLPSLKINPISYKQTDEFDRFHPMHLNETEALIAVNNCSRFFEDLLMLINSEEQSVFIKRFWDFFKHNSKLMIYLFQKQITKTVMTELYSRLDFKLKVTSMILDTDQVQLFKELIEDFIDKYNLMALMKD